MSYKKYRDINVYDAAIERVNFIFDNFKKIYVSFSGGKDSGVCTHLMCEEARKRGVKIGLLFIDIEAHYQKTVEFAHRMFEEYKDVVDPYWVCLPMSTNNSLSYFEEMWSWWDPDKEEVWTREMPKDHYVINLDNNPFPFYKYKMTFEEFTVKFGEWYAGDEDTACIVGIRTQESLNRWRAITNDRKARYKDKNFTTKISEHLYNCYPIYDWLVEDDWRFYGKTGKDYNRLYDLMYQAGIPINKMRVDEPFGDEAKVSLNMFRMIEPDTWGKVVNRVSGANFGNIYGRSKAVSGRFQLPQGHTWKSFTFFLLETLPEKAAQHYWDKFQKFIKYWQETGSPMSEESIAILENNYSKSIINTHEFSKRGKGDKEVIKFTEVVDTIPELDTKDDVLTWKRMAMCIIKNDYYCRGLSFSITKEQREKRNAAMQKYKDIL